MCEKRVVLLFAREEVFVVSHLRAGVSWDNEWNNVQCLQKHTAAWEMFVYVSCIWLCETLYVCKGSVFYVPKTQEVHSTSIKYTHKKLFIQIAGPQNIQHNVYYVHQILRDCDILTNKSKQCQGLEKMFMFFVWIWEMSHFVKHLCNKLFQCLLHALASCTCRSLGSVHYVRATASQEAYMGLHHSQLSARPINHVNKSYQPPCSKTNKPINDKQANLFGKHRDVKGNLKSKEVT